MELVGINFNWVDLLHRGGLLVGNAELWDAVHLVLDDGFEVLVLRPAFLKVSEQLPVSFLQLLVLFREFDDLHFNKRLLFLGVV